MLPDFKAGIQPMPFFLDGSGGQLIFDDNLTDGGLSLSLQTPTFMGIDIRGIAAQFINEDAKTGINGGTGVAATSAATNDSWDLLYSGTQHPKFEGSQVVLDWTDPAHMMGLSVGAAYYDWFDVKGTSIASQGGSATYINNVNALGFEANDFAVDDYLAVFNEQFGGLPFKAYYEYEANTVAVRNNTGYIGGAEISTGDLVPWNTNEITVGYNYRRAETDSTLSIWDFSDFDGGGTDAMGGEFYAKLMLADNLWVSTQDFYDEGNIQAESVGGHYSQFQRTQVDLNAKF